MINPANELTEDDLKKMGLNPCVDQEAIIETRKAHEEYILKVKDIGENLDTLTPREVLAKARELKLIDSLEFLFEKIFRELEKKQ